MATRRPRWTGYASSRRCSSAGLGGHGARIDLLARLLCALFEVTTVNLAPLAPARSGRADR